MRSSSTADSKDRLGLAAISELDRGFDGQPAGGAGVCTVGGVPSTGSRCPTIWTGAVADAPRQVEHGSLRNPAAARLVGPVPRDRVTPPCCGRGGVTRSFSCRPASGGNGISSSTGHTGHRSTAPSMVRRRAELVRSPLRGRSATSHHWEARGEHISAGSSGDGAGTAAHSSRTRCCAYGHCAGLAWTLAVGRVGPMSHAVSVR
jgi:hypothetical protein